MTKYLGVATDDMSNAANLVYDETTVADVLDNAMSLPNYAALRAFHGEATGVRITAPGISGWFQRQPPGLYIDNGGTIIVDILGRGWFRLYADAINVAWFSLPASPPHTVAFQSAYDLAPDGSTITVPGPGPYVVGTLVGSKRITWDVLFDVNTSLSLLQLPGLVECRIGSSKTVYRANGLGTEFATLRITRLANYTGGTPGNVCSNINVQTTVSNGAQSFEWGITSVLDNSGPGQNVAVYGQGNRRAVSAITLGGTFAGVFEARDFTEEADPTTGLIGMEVDIFANGTDAVGRRVGIDLVVGKGVSTGLKCEALAGLRLGAVLGDTTRGRFRNAILINGDKDYGMQITGVGVENSINITATGGKAGVSVSGTNSDADFISVGTSQYGMRLSGTYSSGIALRLASGSAIAFEPTGAIRLNFATNAWRLSNGGTERLAISTTNGAISINTTQVVAPRITGWNAPTGTITRGTFDVATATTASTAQALAAIITDLRTHGLIGT